MSALPCPQAARLHCFVVLLIGLSGAAAAFAFACRVELAARDAIFAASAESYLDANLARMREASRSLHQLHHWLRAPGTAKAERWKDTLTPVLQGNPLLAAAGYGQWRAPAAGEPVIELVRPGQADSADDACKGALHGLLDKALAARTLLASEICLLRDAANTHYAFGLLAPPAPADARFAAALLRIDALFAPRLPSGPQRRKAAYEVTVYGGRAADASAAIFRHRPGWPAPGRLQRLCGAPCAAGSLARTYRWAGKDWHVVVRNQPFGLDDVPASAFGFLLACVLVTAAALAFIARRDAIERRVGALASLRTRELGALNAILLDDIVARKKVADDLSRSQQQLRELAEHNAKVKEEERKRIAREIHDDLGQNMLALRIDLSLLEEGDPKEITRERIRQAIDQIDTTMSSMRLIINELRPAVLDLGLEAAIEWEGAKFQRRTGIACTVRVAPDRLRLPDAVSAALYRIVQESLTNIMRHAQATQVEIDLWSENGWMFMTLSDNGVGMAQDCRRKTKSFGLIGIAERIYALGGAFDTDSAAGAGTRLTIALPFTPVEEATDTFYKENAQHG